MRKRVWLWVGLVVALALATPFAVTAYKASRERAEYEEQLRLARAEGIPTTAEEYAALIPSAKDTENAAPIYRRIKVGRGAPDLTSLAREAAVRPNAQTIAKARALVNRSRGEIALAEQATALPRCWFDRDWEGAATLFPEFAALKNVARLVGLRGSIAAFEGDPERALADAKRILAIARHAGEEPHIIARLVQEGIWVMAQEHLAGWAFNHLDVREYKAALKEAVATIPRPNVQQENLDEAYSIIWLMENADTKEGQEKLGLKPDDIPSAAEKIFPLLLSKSKSRIKVVRALRARWAAYALPPDQRGPAIGSATDELLEGLLAFPTAAKLYDMFNGDASDWKVERERTWEARRQRWVGLSRALEGPSIPRSINVSDLLSPYDGKPLIYRFDGEQVTLKVSGERSEPFKFPKAPN